MKRNESWRLEYHRERYMSHLSGDQLDQRFRDVCLNFALLTKEGKIGAPPQADGGDRWRILYSHLLEEYKLRYGGPIPGRLRNLDADDPTRTGPGEAAELVSGMDAKTAKRPAKYGNSKFMKPAWRRGKIRIAPATYYVDPSLNRVTPGSDLMTEATPQLGGEGLPESIETTTNYYVYCISTGVHPRLFQDFDADACIAFDNWREFNRRLQSAVQDRLPGWRLTKGLVSYFDPLRDPFKEEAFFFSKHFRYSYQEEYRYVWVPPSPVKNLDPMTINIGSIRDISELFTSRRFK